MELITRDAVVNTVDGKLTLAFMDDGAEVSRRFFTDDDQGRADLEAAARSWLESGTLPAAKNNVVSINSRKAAGAD